MDWSLEIGFLAEVFPLQEEKVLRGLFERSGYDIELCVKELTELMGGDLSDGNDDNAQELELQSLIDLGIDPIEILYSKLPHVPAHNLRATLEYCGQNVSSALSVLLSNSGSQRVSKDENDIELLQSLFPTVDRSDLQSALKAHSNNVEEAAEFLVKAEHMNGVTAVPQLEGGREYDVIQLKEMFPKYSDADLKKILRVQGGLHRSINYLAERNSDPSAVARYERAGGPAPFSKVAAAQKDLTTASWFNFQVSGGRSTDAGEPDSNVRNSYPFTDSNDHMDPDYCRKMASEYHQKRVDAFQRAASCFKRGKLTGRGTAAYYAEMGQAETKKMEHWNRLAATAVLRQNGELHKQEAGSIIDLHGLTRAEALKAIDHHVNEWYNAKGANSYPSAPLKVITGSGSHSKKNEPVLLPSVLGHLKKTGWKTHYEPGQGWFYVVPKQ
ncbi:hypothetical protein BC829DRAFT_436255 [Chytridium lagenaria]|nr:hypothetical protein BC829DRAFT_436255 [Chytridium lagenaria]